jgi:transposase
LSRTHLGTAGRNAGAAIPLQLAHPVGDRRGDVLNFYFRLYPGAIKSEQIIEFLTALQRQVGRKLLIIWDGLAAHRSSKVRHHVERLDGAIQLERLPAYAPELNPVEYVWGYLKHHALPNFCARDFADLTHTARRRLASMQRRPRLITAFWKQAELF